jgi:uncharacterized protein (TIGR02145 family)
MSIMKMIALLFVFIAFNSAYAQNYQISFSGSGASSTVDSVKVENISQCKDTVISGSNILFLMGTVGINSISNVLNNSLRVYPNPMNVNCLVEFEAASSGNASLELFDVTGRRIVKQNSMLSVGIHSYTLSGISSGIYFLKITSETYSYSTKLVNLNTVTGKAQINYKGTKSTEGDNYHFSNISGINIVRCTPQIIYMQYTNGNRLKFTGYSGGVYRTIIMLVPANSQTVSFNFAACVDANGNNYSVVQIGTKLWMAENLKATKYRNGTNIPNVPDSASWTNTSSGAYCDYRNIPAEGSVYGHLYNWYAGADVQNIAPVGWHVSTNDEWTNMSNLLGGDGIAGQKLKENCDTRWAFLDTTWGTNEYGFTALCSNFRSNTGAWSMAPNHDHDCFFWTSTEGINSSVAHCNSLRWCYRDIWRTPGVVPKKHGASIRCVQD